MPDITFLKPVFVLVGLFYLSACNAGPRVIPASELSPITSSSDEPSEAIEASGITYLGENQYLIVSDETDRILSLNKHWDTHQSHPIQSEYAIDDLESISIYNKQILVCSSANPNKQGTLDKDRRHCHLLNQDDNRYASTTSFDLYKSLKQAAKSSEDEELKKFVKKALKKNKQDIEAHAILNGHLLVGFKKPRLNDRAVIVDIGPVQRLISNKRTEAQIWKLIHFGEIDSESKFRLSDMAWMAPNKLLLTTSGKGKSALWLLNTDSDRLTQLSIFLDAQAEGVTYNSKQKSAVVVFDGGNGNGSLAYSVPVP